MTSIGAADSKKTSATASAEQQLAQQGRLVDVPPGGMQAGAYRVALGLLDAGVQVDQQRAADQERADVDEQRRGCAGGGDDGAGEHRAEHERAREGDVQRRVRPALGLLRLVLEALAR